MFKKIMFSSTFAWLIFFVTISTSYCQTNLTTLLAATTTVANFASISPAPTVATTRISSTILTTPRTPTTTTPPRPARILSFGELNIEIFSNPLMTFEGAKRVCESRYFRLLSPDFANRTLLDAITRAIKPPTRTEFPMLPFGNNQPAAALSAASPPTRPLPEQAFPFTETSEIFISRFWIDRNSSALGNRTTCNIVRYPTVEGNFMGVPNVVQANCANRGGSICMRTPNTATTTVANFASISPAPTVATTRISSTTSTTPRTPTTTTPPRPARILSFGELNIEIFSNPLMTFEGAKRVCESRNSRLLSPDVSTLLNDISHNTRPFTESSSGMFPLGNNQRAAAFSAASPPTQPLSKQAFSFTEPSGNLNGPFWIDQNSSTSGNRTACNTVRFQPVEESFTGVLHVVQANCADRSGFICMRNRTKCFPEVAAQCDPVSTKLCQPATNNSLPTIRCLCKFGFEQDTRLSCKDIDECRPSYSNDCSPKAACRNTVGGFTCVCPTGMAGDGYMCQYASSLEQVFTNLTYNAAYENVSSPEFAQLNLRLQKEILPAYKNISKSVTNLILRKVQPGSVVATYDIYSSHKTVTSLSLVEFYKESVRIEGSIASNIGAQTPKAANLVCYGSNVASIEDPTRKYYFPDTSPEMFATSNCTKEFPFFAYVKCVASGSSANFDRSTLFESSCNVTSNDTDLKPSPNPTSESIALLMSKIAAVTTVDIQSSVSSGNPKNTQTAAKAIASLGKQLSSSNIQVEPTTMNNLIVSVNNIHEVEEGAAKSTLSASEKQDLVNALEIFASRVNLTEHREFRSITESLEVYVILSNLTQNVVDIPFTNNNFLPSSCAQVSNSRAVIPASALRMAAQRMKSTNPSSYSDHIEANVAFFLYEDDVFFEDINQPINVKVNKVLTAQIGLQQVDNLVDPFVFQLPPTTSGPSERQWFRCSYWHTNNLKWASDGCKVNTSTSQPSCLCNHMTNFALLVQSFPDNGNYGLEIVGKVCLSISVIGLSLTLIIFLYHEKLRQNLVSKIHINLCLCLLISNFVFLVVVERPRAFNECSGIAAILHFFMVSAFGWMAVECFTMFRMLVQVFSVLGDNYVFKAGCAVYCFAAVALVITIGITIGWQDQVLYGGWTSATSDILSTYISDRMCWLHGPALYFGFLLPAGICLVLNSVGFFFIIRAITWGRKRIQSSRKDKAGAKDGVARVLIISVLLGLTWGLAIPLTFSKDLNVNLVFGYLFSVTNGLQGAALFFLLCVRRQDVRNCWWNPFKKFICCRDDERSESKDSGSSSWMRPGRNRASTTLSLTQRMKRSSAKDDTKVTEVAESTFRPVPKQRNKSLDNGIAASEEETMKTESLAEES